MTAEAYDLDRSRRSVRELYPVLLDAHGNVIDGYHRLDVDPDWRTETLSHIETPAQLWAARIVANGCRRDVSRSERAEQFAELARCLAEEEGVSREDMVSTVSKLTTFSDRYVRGLLPNEYKRGYTPPEKSELSSEYEDLAKREESAEALNALGIIVPAASQPRGRPLAPASSSGGRVGTGAAESGTPESQAGSGLLPQLPPGAPANQEQVTVPTEHRPGAEPVAHIAAQPGTPGPTQPLDADAGAGAPGHSGPEETREEALDYIRRYHDRHPKPDAEYLSWEVAINVGVTEREALELIRLVQSERGIAGQGKSSVAGPMRGSVTCPLCSREGAERGRILGRVRDPQIGQLTLRQFVLEVMG